MASRILRIADSMPGMLREQQAWRSHIETLISGIHRGQLSMLDYAVTAIERMDRLHGRRAQDICDLVVEYGWSVDALMELVDNDALEDTYRALNEEGPAGYAHVFGALIEAAHEEFREGIHNATLRLLPPQVATDFNAAFNDAVEAVLSRDKISMVAATMLSRAEGVFTRALFTRGLISRNKSLLYTNQTQFLQERETVLEHLDDRLMAQPARGRRLLVTMSARQRFNRIRDQMVEREQTQPTDQEPAPRSRHEVLHDGYGSGTYPEALRALLFYANVALFLDRRLEPLIPEDTTQE